MDGRRVSADVERIARWWTAAPQEARFALYRASLEGDPQAPSLETLRLASFLAEAEAGEIAEG